MTIPNPFDFLRAMLRAGRAAAHGKSVLVTERQQSRRLRICAACPFYDGRVHQCNKCGCFVDLKTLLRTESCPVGRWSDMPLTRQRLVRTFQTICQKISRTIRRVLPPEP